MRFLLTLALLAVSAPAQTGFYTFALDEDRLGGAPDFSFLNHPLQAVDRLTARDGHFYTVAGDPVRLFGANLAFGANFPAEADAPRIAKRLRKLGVNLVRLHHMDSQPDSTPSNAGSLLTTGPYPTLNTVAVARLRAFLNALRAEGIYVNLNLHVGYQFRPSVDGIPALPGGVAFPTQSKPLHILYPRMIQLQTDYTRNVINALSLKDDPVLGTVEIDNETSLLREWQSSNLDRWLLGDYLTEFQRQWNAFLTAKYRTTATLAAAWGSDGSDGPELLPGTWRALEVHSPSQATMQSLADGVVKVTVTQGGAPVILKQVGFSMTQGDPYVAEVEVRADLAAGVSRNVYWDIKQDTTPWNTEIGLTVAVTSEWKEVGMGFVAGFAMAGNGRFGLSVEGVDAPIYVRNCSLRKAGRRGLASGESIEAANVALVAETELGAQARTDDYLLFLADRDRYYLGEMLRAVRETAGALVPVAGTQMGYGGLLNLDSHAAMDYQDNHFYIDHYNFPNTSWDGRDWRIRDSSSLGSGLGTFLSMAAAREANRPYTVSEFNQPWPNTYAAEIDPTLAVFGAFQDWDSIMHFAYAHSRNWDDAVPNGFNITGDWTKAPNIGQAAWLFRSGAIRPATEEVTAPVSLAMRLRAGREKKIGVSSFLSSAAGFNPDVALIHRVAVARDEAGTMPVAATAARSSPFAADTAEFTYDRTNRLFLIHAAQAAGVIGFAGQGKVTAGAIDVELAAGARGFSTVLLTALDGQPIRDSGKLLLSTPGYAMHTQPQSSPQRPQRLVNYPGTTDWWTLEQEPAYLNKPSGNMNGGEKPVWMERIESFVTLRTNASQIAVYPLDGAGARLAPIATERVAGGFRLHLQAEGQPASPWYEITAAKVASVSAASFVRGAAGAPEAIMSGFGEALTSSAPAGASFPLPTTLSGVAVRAQDSAGTERAAQLFYVSPSQINYVVPSGTATGLATITVTTQGQTTAAGTLQIDTVAPGLFAANANGIGVAAAAARRVAQSGAETWYNVFGCGPAAGSCVPTPLDLGSATDLTYLHLYGTGIRGRSALSAVGVKIGGVDATVSAAGALAGVPGLDEVQVLIPRSLAGHGEAAVDLTVDGKRANTVTVSLQ